MEVVLAGDIIGSQKNKPSDYLKVIESILKIHSKEGMYQIYRGDSFQAWIKTPELGLFTAIKLKAALKRTGTLDVRIAIGLGNLTLVDNNIAKSTGNALIRSGELLDSLKNEEQNIMVSSGNYSLDNYMNTALKLALSYMNDWTVNASVMIYEIYNNPTVSSEIVKIKQAEASKILGIKQSSISRRLERANIKETDALLHLFHNQYYKDLDHADTH